MEGMLMDGRSWFNLPNMDQMLNESTKEELLKLCQSQGAGLEAAVLSPGIKMIIIEIETTTEIGIIEGEAAVEVEGGMNVTDTRTGRKITVDEAAVAV